MELWVRTQPIDGIRGALVKVDNIGVDDDGYIKTDARKGFMKLAKYETHERALEVLDEIQNILKPKYILDSSSIKEEGNSWAENGMILQKYNANAKIKELSTYVYQMPED